MLCANFYLPPHKVRVASNVLMLGTVHSIVPVYVCKF